MQGGNSWHPAYNARLRRYAGTDGFGNGNPARRPGRRGERHRQQLEPEMPGREVPGGHGNTRQMQRVRPRRDYPAVVMVRITSTATIA